MLLLACRSIEYLEIVQANVMSFASKYDRGIVVLVLSHHRPDGEGEHPMRAGKSM